jgi:hypothetical protein
MFEREGERSSLLLLNVHLLWLLHVIASSVYCLIYRPSLLQMLTSARSATCSQLQRTTLALTSARIPVLVASEPSSSRPSYHEPHARRSFSKFPLRRAKDAASGSGKKPHSMVKMVLDWEGLSSRTNVGKARREELVSLWSSLRS